jgi:hypothetical protein
MTDEEYKKYVDTRFKKLTGYYDKRSQQNKRLHRICSVLIIGISGTLAPLISTGVLSNHRITGGLLSAGIVIVTAVSAHFQFNENWLAYRATWDALEREPHLREAGIGEYADASDRNSLFVQRVEEMVSEQGSEWLSRHRRLQDRPAANRSSDATG